MSQQITEIRLTANESVNHQGKVTSHPKGSTLPVGQKITPERARWLVLAGRAVDNTPKPKQEPKAKATKADAE